MGFKMRNWRRYQKLGQWKGNSTKRAFEALGELVTGRFRVGSWHRFARGLPLRVGRVGLGRGGFQRIQVKSAHHISRVGRSYSS